MHRATSALTPQLVPPLPRSPGVFAGTWGLSGWDLAILVLLLAVGGAYVAALARSWRRAGVGRGIRLWEAGAFALGWAALLTALIGLDGLSSVLFSAHMTQHELLMLIAAPLVVLGRPLVVLVWLLPWHLRLRIRRAQRPLAIGVWRRLTAPVTVLVVHAVVVWLWHAPALFEAALRSEAIHALQHLCFFWTALLFWWALVHGRYGRVGYGVAVAFVFITAMHTTLLGALLTFAPTVWYPTYGNTVTALGGSPIEDQQLAGLLMWVPSGVIFLLIALGLFAAWLGESARRAPSAVR